MGAQVESILAGQCLGAENLLSPDTIRVGFNRGVPPVSIVVSSPNPLLRPRSGVVANTPPTEVGWRFSPFFVGDPDGRDVDRKINRACSDSPLGFRPGCSGFPLRELSRCRCRGPVAAHEGAGQQVGSQDDHRAGGH